MLCAPTFAMHYSAIGKMLTSHAQESLSQQCQLITNNIMFTTFPFHSFSHTFFIQPPLSCFNCSTHLSLSIKHLALLYSVIWPPITVSSAVLIMSCNLLISSHQSNLVES
ncbi:hypothetical protein I7I48_06855 [Histoplasma ohiense]|nr:hypothetical protein I7I48_06855 [Histoplasma ohiense (nom. inval.)]